MAKTDWITWKTNTNEIINPDTVMVRIKDILTNYKNYMNNVVVSEIRNEIVKGGLSQNSLNILGTSPAYEEAKNITVSIDQVNEEIDQFINKVNNLLIEQKKIEKQELIDAITNKLLEEESKLTNTLNLKAKLSDNNNVISIDDVNEVIEITSERIKRLKERLDLAKAL